MALARLPEFTAQQLVLTLHAMAQLGYHPGARFLEAWASCLCERMRAPLPLPLASPLEEDGQGFEDPLQNLSLAFVALAILQSPPPACLWAAAEAAILLPMPPAPAPAQQQKPPPRQGTLRLIDVASLLWSLAALDFPPDCPPGVVEGLLSALGALLPPLAQPADAEGKEGKGPAAAAATAAVVIDKQAASQVRAAGDVTG